VASGAVERADDHQLEVTAAGYTYAVEPPRSGLVMNGDDSKKAMASMMSRRAKRDCHSAPSRQT
jgi:hypothetical protein